MTYSAPERSTERALARRLMGKILREGSMCSVCLNREPNNPLKYDVCKQFGRAYPLCRADDGGPTFEPDYQRLEGVTHAPSK